MSGTPTPPTVRLDGLEGERVVVHMRDNIGRRLDIAAAQNGGRVEDPFLAFAGPGCFAEAAVGIESPRAQLPGRCVLADHLKARGRLVLVLDGDVHANVGFLAPPFVFGGDLGVVALGGPGADQPVEIAQRRAVAGPFTHDGHEPFAVLAHVQNRVLAMYRRLLADANLEMPFLDGRVARGKANGIDIDVHFDFAFSLGELVGIVVFDRSSAANSGAVVGDVLAVLGPVGGDRLGVAAFERVDETARPLGDGLPIGRLQLALVGLLRCAAALSVCFVSWSIAEREGAKHHRTCCHRKHDQFPLSEHGASDTDG